MWVERKYFSIDLCNLSSKITQNLVFRPEKLTQFSWMLYHQEEAVSIIYLTVNKAIAAEQLEFVALSSSLKQQECSLHNETFLTSKNKMFYSHFEKWGWTGRTVGSSYIGCVGKGQYFNFHQLSEGVWFLGCKYCLTCECVNSATELQRTRLEECTCHLHSRVEISRKVFRKDFTMLHYFFHSFPSNFSVPLH